MHTYDYQDYVTSYDQRETANHYNDRYKINMREMDKLILNELIHNNLSNSQFRLIDLGCGNGNFLFQLKNNFPSSRLVGKDLAESTIMCCKNDNGLAGIEFVCSDITQPPMRPEIHSYDYVILIAVLQVLPPDIFRKALSSIALYLKPNGWLLNIDGYHDFSEHDFVVAEIYPRKDLSPDLSMMKYFYPSQSKMREMLNSCGFDDVSFIPFSMPFDIARREDNPFGSHTCQVSDGRRLSMLGIVAQPWCLLKAQRKLSGDTACL